MDRSLSVRPSPTAPDGFIVHSHAGDDALACKDYVRSKIGAAPFEAKGKTNGSKVSAVYDYVDESGELLFQVVRFDPKRFLQRQPDGKGGHIWNSSGVRRVPYHLPELIEAVACERPVFIAEGEEGR